MYKRQVHEILRKGLSDSPLFNGQIQSIGPRYCPSIETKIVTFPDKPQHQLFLEPEGETTQELYLNGFSSSLPMDIQLAALKKVPAFKDLVVYRPGYAIEYDYFDPTQLKHTLESKIIKNLFLAGQVNGTTGYEEAGGQGIIAGINAHMMNDFGAKAKWLNEYQLKVEPQPYQSIPFYVESDWSAASYWYQIAALSNKAEIILPGLFETSYQGDSKVAEIFQLLGIESIYGNKMVTLKKTDKIAERLDYDFINQPDLAQTFVVTCALMNIPFRFSGLQSLKIKETDRITALIKEMGKLGYILHEIDDRILSWEGERCEMTADAAIDTYEDHRMAMAFAPVCVVMPEIRINNPQVVSKSYPYYWEDLKKAGFIIEEI